jgi:transposase-like protein
VSRATAKSTYWGCAQGATENAAAYSVLGGLIERETPSRSHLAVIDGAKALHKAVSETFGHGSLIHCCHAYKKRNVIHALPERRHASACSAMTQAHATRNPKRARCPLENLARRLESAHAATPASLGEALEETMTVMRLDLPENLARVVSSTNLIEKLFSRVRDSARWVKYWQGGTMILRSTAAGVLEAERNFRKVVAYRAMPKLVAALRTHDAEIDLTCGIENRKGAA